MESNLVTLIDEAAKAEGHLHDAGPCDALAAIQKNIGVESGDFAGLYFSCDKSENWATLPYEVRLHLLISYVYIEIAQCLSNKN